VCKNATWKKFATRIKKHVRYGSTAAVRIGQLSGNETATADVALGHRAVQDALSYNAAGYCGEAAAGPGAGWSHLQTFSYERFLGIKKKCQVRISLSGDNTQQEQRGRYICSNCQQY
jgi:hypothetical protein